MNAETSFAACASWGDAEMMKLLQVFSLAALDDLFHSNLCDGAEVWDVWNTLGRQHGFSHHPREASAPSALPEIRQLSSAEESELLNAYAVASREFAKGLAQVARDGELRVGPRALLSSGKRSPSNASPSPTSPGGRWCSGRRRSSCSPASSWPSWGDPAPGNPPWRACSWGSFARRPGESSPASTTLPHQRQLLLPLSSGLWASWGPPENPSRIETMPRGLHKSTGPGGEPAVVVADGEV
jgi:hypothetical protein